MATKSWFNIQARSGAEGQPLVAAIEIYDEIGGWGKTAKDFKNELAALGDVEGIELSIHSPGGSVLDGWAIYNLLKASKAHVVAKIDGLAASMATVVAMAADEVHMPENAFFMIHNPSGLAIGGAEEMRDYADLLDKMQGGIRAAYAGKTGLDDDKLDELMAAETWFTGSEAKELGFVDVVTDALEMAALDGLVASCAEDLTKSGLNLPDNHAEVEEIEEIEETIEEPVSDLTEHGELIEEEVTEVAEEISEEIVDEVAEPPAGIVERVKAALIGRSGGSDARAELAELHSRYTTLEAKLAESAEIVDSLRADVAAKEENLQAMSAERQTVLDLVTEAGFAPEAAAELPMPDGDDVGELASAEAAVQAASAKGGAELYTAVKRLQELREKE